jgi:Cdc6-like AAA superfamily ATPase
MLLSGCTVFEWILLGLLALVAFMVAYGTYTIRMEVRSRARLRAEPVRLKTTEAQRQLWRRTTQSREMIILLDDIDTLLIRLGND